MSPFLFLGAEWQAAVEYQGEVLQGDQPHGFSPSQGFGFDSRPQGGWREGEHVFQYLRGGVGVLLAEPVRGGQADAVLLLDDPWIGRVHVSGFHERFAHVLRRVHGLRPFHFHADGLAVEVHVAYISHVLVAVQTQTHDALVIQCPLQIGFDGGFHARAVAFRGLAVSRARHMLPSPMSA